MIFKCNFERILLKFCWLGQVDSFFCTLLLNVYCTVIPVPERNLCLKMYQRKNSSTAEIKLEENLVEYKKIKENSFSSVKDKLCRGSGSLCRVQRLFQFKMLCICIQILLFVRKNNLLFLTLLLKTNLFSSFKYKKRTTGSDKNPVIFTSKRIYPAPTTYAK